MSRFIARPALLAAALLASPLAAQAKVVAIGMAKSDNHVYAWHDDRSVTSGSLADFELHRKAATYSLPSGRQPSDIVGVAVDTNDRVHAWYADGTWSIGHSKDLDAYQAAQNFTLPAGRTTADIVGMAFNSTGNVYTWYDDASVSVGQPQALATIQLPLGVALPSDQTVQDIVEIDISAADRVVTWFRDGRYTIGKSRDLDAYEGPAGYRSSKLISRYWGPLTISLPPFVAARDEPEASPDLPLEAAMLTDELARIASGRRPADNSDTPFRMAPIWNERFMANTGRAVDSMVAAGHDFLIASDTGTLRFLDRDGNLLAGKGGFPTSMSSTAFFGGFLQKQNADGSFNDSNVNNFLGYDDRCDSAAFPATNGNRFCLTSFYDTRVHYDAASRRFFVVANSRHPVWVTTSGGNCLRYTNANGDPVDTMNYCGAQRRLIALAVSRTSDPRDGFHQYMITDNIYRDFPWMTINGDRVVVGGVGRESNDTITPVATMLDMSDLRLGDRHPAYTQYYSGDLAGSIRAIPVRHFDDGAGKTLLLDGSGSTLKILALPSGPDAWTKGVAQTTSVAIEGGLSNLPAATYRNGFLYFAQRTIAETVGDRTRRSVRLVRVPLQIAGNGLIASTNAADGYVEDHFGLRSLDDAPTDTISYEAPSMAVNASGDMLFGYGRYPFETLSPLFPEARYSLWRANLTLERSALLQAGQGTCGETPAEAVDYTTVDVDPVDGQSFWMALPFCNASNGYSTVIGRVTP
ncbi:MAG TPA: hypothetical protein VLF18_05230 [Tahibacter sp.]|uniref:hypothetical protein n=1 Tax=Tahibacter sp. TaxID=2056211 RepID=UPI002CA9D97F|nr:hypothetical protein [Tahibacter sp.]HSX59580.1 hypothetical protein [Tahibacter sp.]